MSAPLLLKSFTTAPCMSITGIFTNPPTNLERELQYDTMAIAVVIAGAVSSR
jgi:hypothetical protein